MFIDRSDATLFNIICDASDYVLKNEALCTDDIVTALVEEEVKRECTKSGKKAAMTLNRSVAILQKLWLMK
jgi:hypothetical protein